MDSSNLSYKFASYSYSGVPLLTYGLIGLSVVFISTAYGLNVMDTNKQGGFFSGGGNKNANKSKTRKNIKHKKGTLKKKLKS